MSSKKISQLTALTTSDSTDVIPIVDLSADETKKQTKANFLKEVQAELDAHETNVSNPHSVTKAQVGLGNVLNAEQALAAEKGANNGLATLDAGGKVPASQLPNTVMEYKGAYNVVTNTPALADGTGNAGDVYVNTAAGTRDFGSGSITFDIGDWIIYNGTIWEKSSSTAGVSSINGQQGIVTLDTDDIAEGATNLYFTTVRAQGAVSRSFIKSTLGAATVMQDGYLTKEDWASFNSKVSFPGFSSLSADYGFTDNSTDWDTAFGWGNHAEAGYLSALVGGDTQVTFFDGANAPAGHAGFTYNKTTATATLAGGLSTATLTAGGTASGSVKALIINNGTSTGNIAEFQDDGSAVFTIADGGAVTTTGKIIAPINAVSYTFAGVPTYGLQYSSALGGILLITGGNAYAGATATNGFEVSLDGVTFKSGTLLAGTADTFLQRKAAATLQMGRDVNGSAVNQTFKAHDGITGTNISGANLTFAAGRGTGTGSGGVLYFQTAPVEASGTTAQTLVTRMTIEKNGVTKLTTPVGDAWTNVSVDGVTMTVASTRYGSSATSRLEFGETSANRPTIGPGAGVYLQLVSGTTGLLFTANNGGSFMGMWGTGGDLTIGSAATAGARLEINGVTGSKKSLLVNNSASTGNILELQDNGTARFVVADGGAVTATGSGFTVALTSGALAIEDGAGGGLFTNPSGGWTWLEDGDGHNRFFMPYTASNSTINNNVRIDGHRHAATVTGYGTGLLFTGRDTTTQDAEMVRVSGVWTDATHASRSAALVFETVNNAGSLTERARIAANGNVGIGVAAPTAVLHLKAGTATADTAPLKFTSGALNTAAVAGQMEYDNTFHLTNSDATRRHVTLAPNATKVTAAAPYTNDGYILINIAGSDFKVMTTA